jgi:hypothetical protein
MPQGKGTYGKKRGRPPTKKKLTPKQKKIASAAAPKDKITGADFRALRRNI